MNSAAVYTLIFRDSRSRRNEIADIGTETIRTMATSIDPIAKIKIGLTAHEAMKPREYEIQGTKADPPNDQTINRPIRNVVAAIDTMIATIPFGPRSAIATRALGDPLFDVII